MFLGGVLELEPSISYSTDTQWLDEDNLNIGRQTRDAYHAQVRASTVLERVFEFNWREYTALKHKIRPSITYDFRGHRDEDLFRPWFEAIDAEDDVNRITFSIENILDSRKDDMEGKIHYAQWGTFTLSQPYNLTEARRDDDPDRDREPFEPLIAEINAFPFSWLDVDAEARWDHYRTDIVYADISAGLSLERSAGRRDRFALEYQYEQDEYQYLGYRVHLNLPGGFSLGTALRKELERGHTLDSAYWLDYQAQCWGLRLSAGSLDGIESFSLTVNFLGLGGVGDL
jgi:hypothetical protein